MHDKADYLGEGLLFLGAIIPICLFLIGIIFGSFLNVCIYRIPRGMSIVRPPSHCPACNASIRWYDNVPLISVIWLRGRCRQCHGEIPFRYFAVEVGLGLWLVANYFVFMASPNAFLQPLVANAILGFLLIGLIVIDWQWHRLPDAFTLTGIAIGFFLVCLQAIFLGPKDDQIVLNTTHQLRMSSPGSFQAKGNVFLTGPEALIFGRLAAIVGAALILLLVRWIYKALRKREGLGLGDVKMLAMVAAFLGFWPAVLTLFLGTMLAAAYGLLLMLRGKAGALTKLPLGSFLGIAGLFAALFGDGVIQWYRGLLP